MRLVLDLLFSPLVSKTSVVRKAELTTSSVIQEGSFGGPIIYQNKQFVSPNQIRSDLRRAKAHRHDARSEQIAKGMSKRQDLGLSSNGVRREKDELDTQRLFS